MKITLISTLLLILILGSEASHLSQNRKIVRHRRKNGIEALIEKDESTNPSEQGIELIDEDQQQGQGQDQLPKGPIIAEEDLPQNDQISVDDLTIPPPERELEVITWQDYAAQYGTFGAFYEAYLGAQQQLLTDLEEEKAGQEAECQALEEQISELERQVEKTEAYIAWLIPKIEEAQVKIQKIFVERCDSHSIFIEYFKNAKITLRLIDFLRFAIQNYEMVQLQQVQQVLVQLKNPRILNNSDDLQKLLVQVKQIDGGDVERYGNVGQSLEDRDYQRTDEQIGQRHVDAGRDRIEVDAFESSERRNLENYKEEMTNILNEIEANIQESIENRQENEVELNDRVVAFVETQEVEINHLEQEIEQQRETLESLQAEIAATTYLSEICQQTVEELEILIENQTTVVEYVVDNKDTLEEDYIDFHSAKSVDITAPRNVINSARPSKGGSAQNHEASAQLRWNPTEFISYNMRENNNGMKIPALGLDTLKIGLAWDDNNNDLEAAVYLTDFKSNTQKIVMESDRDDKVIFEDVEKNSQEDQYITLKLKELDGSYDHLYFALFSYRDGTFLKNNAVITVTLYIEGAVFSTYTMRPSVMSEAQNTTAFVFADVFRNINDGKEWYIKNQGLWFTEGDNGYPRNPMHHDIALALQDLGKSPVPLLE